MVETLTKSKSGPTVQLGGFAVILIDGSEVKYLEGVAPYVTITGFDVWCIDAVILAMIDLAVQINEHVPIDYHDTIEWVIKPPSESRMNPLDPVFGTVGWKTRPVKI